jgi:hypothetical protein
MFSKRRLSVGILTVAACLMSGQISWGQETVDPVVEQLHEKVSLFLESISHGSALNAFEKFLIGSPLLKKTADSRALVKKTGEFTGLYGEYRAFERISAKRIGNDLVLMKYLYKCETFPVVWYFTFYRTPPRGERPADTVGSWRAIIVRFDTELELLGLDN